MYARPFLALLFLLNTNIIDARGRNTTQIVTVQRFSPSEFAGDDPVYRVTQAMSMFKARNARKLDEVFIGVVPGNPSLIEQILRE